MLLKHAARTSNPGATELEAYGEVKAAEASIQYAATIRNRVPIEERPPAPAFPEKIEADSIPAIQMFRVTVTGANEPTRPPVEIRTPKADSLAGVDPLTLKPGAMVGVIDATHPLFRRMGSIEKWDTAGVTVLVAGQANPEVFQPAQLMKI